MLAPIDATTELTAAGQTFSLQMNFRTIALAEKEWAGAVTDFLGGATTVTGAAVLLWAFAQPKHPTITPELAFAMLMADEKPVVAALVELFNAGMEKADRTENADPDPPAASTS